MGGKLNASSVDERELLPFSGSFQAQSSRTLKRFVIYCELKPPRDTALLSRSSPGMMMQSTPNFPLCSDSVVTGLLSQITVDI